MQTGPIDDKESKFLIDAFSMCYQWIANTHEYCIAPCCLSCTSVQWQGESERKLHYSIVSCVTIGPDIHMYLPLLLIYMAYEISYGVGDTGVHAPEGVTACEDSVLGLVVVTCPAPGKDPFN